MSKVVTEAPRHRHELPSVKTRLRVRNYDPNREYDDLPSRVSGLRLAKRNGQYKSFSDLLGPLRKSLRSNVGRPWDKVYSELCGNLDKRKTTGLHIFEHVEDEVALNCYEAEDGKIYDRDNMWRMHPVEGLYVHPRTRLLCWKEPSYWRKQRLAKKQKRKITRIPISGNRHYIKLNGIWYIAELESNRLDRNSVNIESQHPDNLKHIFVEHDRKWWILQKKQCNSKELKAAGLKNEVSTEPRL